MAEFNFDNKYLFSPSFAKAVSLRYKSFTIPNAKWMSSWFGLKFLEIMTNDFMDTAAYDMGLIDEEGNPLRKPQTSEEKQEYNYYIKLLFNFKKQLNKRLPASSYKRASDVLYLLRENENSPLQRKRQIALFFSYLDNINNIEDIMKPFICEDGAAVGAVEPATTAYAGTVSGDISRIGGTLIDDRGHMGLEKEYNDDLGSKKKKKKVKKRKKPQSFKEYIGLDKDEIDASKMWRNRQDPLAGNGGLITGR